MPFLGTFGAGAGRGFGQLVGGFVGICASGGTTAESGVYKIHTFTSGGTFTVNTLSNDPAANEVDYLVVAGGAGGGGRNSGRTGGGAGGAGGFRTSNATCQSPSPPLAAGTGVTVSAQGYPISIGTGGAGGPGSGWSGGSGGGTSSALGKSSSGGGGGGRSGGGDATNGSRGGSGGG